LLNSDTTQRQTLTVGYIPVDVIKEMIQSITKMPNQDKLRLSRMSSSRLDSITDLGKRLLFSQRRLLHKKQKETKMEKNQTRLPKKKKHTKTRHRKKS